MLTYIDVGAAGELDSKWRRQITERKNVDYIGFEPDSRSYESGNLTRLPVALGELERRRHLHLTAKPQVSSLLRPSKAVLQRYQDVSRFDVVGLTEMSVTPIDALALRGKYFFMKLDTQGTELEILRGATATLSKTLGIVVEVEFQQIYEKQPLFSDLDPWLRQHGFTLEDFVTLKRWTRREGGGPGQLVFGDALYLKDLDHLDLDLEGLAAFAEIARAYSREDLLLKIKNQGFPISKSTLRAARRSTQVRAALSLLNNKLGLDYFHFA